MSLFLPPNAFHDEAMLLGALMIDPAKLAAVGTLEPEHFYSEAHRRIFEAILATAPDCRIVSVMTHLNSIPRERDHRRPSRLHQVGGTPYLVALIENPSIQLARVAEYAAAVRQAWARRQVVRAAQHLEAELRGTDRPVRAALADFTRATRTACADHDTRMKEAA